MRPFPELPGVEHRFVQAGDVRLHVVEAGAGEPVLLVHGWPQNWYAWRAVIPRLADRFRVLAMDLRGFGWSDAPRSTYLKDELAGDVVALLEAEDLRDVRLAGHDWGGYAALLAAARAPERLRSVTAFAVPAPWSTGKPGPRGALTALAYQPLMALPVVGPLAQRHTPVVDFVMRIGARLDPEVRRIYSEQFKEPDRAEAASRLYRSLLTKEVGRPYRGPRLTVPGKLVLGEKDPIVTAKLASGAGIDVEVIPGGHFLLDDSPQLVAERIAAS